MRQAIKAQLIEGVPEVQGRCYEPHEVTASTTKPYLVLKQGIEKEINPWSSFRRIYEIWPYADIGDGFVTVDTLAGKVNTALDKQVLVTGNGQGFSCISLGTSSADFLDNNLNALTRGLTFAVMAVPPARVAETVTNDSWLDALAVWTRNLFGVDWEVYCNTWPLDYSRPSVLWRLANTESKKQGQRSFSILKVMIGHVLGGTPNQQISATTQLFQQLTGENKLVLDPAVKQHLTVDEIAVNYQADPIVKGQITVVISRVTGNPAEEAPLMNAIHDTGTIGI